MAMYYTRGFMKNLKNAQSVISLGILMDLIEFHKE
jgi:hypothetical protein